MIGRGGAEVALGPDRVPVPEHLDGAADSLALGVRPEHVRLDDAAPVRGAVLATEYLGTTQIVTLRPPLAR